MNTVIINGNAQAVVINTGMRTQIGRITKLSQTVKKEKTVLEYIVYWSVYSVYWIFYLFFKRV
ncbi:MAG: hypothetical protein Q8840_02615, partial [Sweet potato little leaf phytoplasma]|nr:hypothetical protein [Sweet potato little leaf phytoplasma]